MHGENHSDLKLKLFEQFIGQKVGSELVYHPEHLGFVYFHKFQEMVIVDEVFVPVESRGKGAARWLMEAVYKWGRDAGCKSCVVTVVFNSETSEQALAAALHDGFKVSKMEQSVITLVKEL